MNSLSLFSTSKKNRVLGEGIKIIFHLVRKSFFQTIQLIAKSQIALVLLVGLWINSLHGRLIWIIVKVIIKNNNVLDSS